MHPDAPPARASAAALLDALEAASTDGRLRLWAHGGHSAAVALRRTAAATSRSGCSGSCAGPLTRRTSRPRRCRTGSRLRAFRPGAGRGRPGWRSTPAPSPTTPSRAAGPVADVAAAGGRAVVRPGRLPARRVARRRRAGRLPLDQGARRAAPPIGEVYVLGVDPAAQRAAARPGADLAGLRHLRGRGLSQVMLYVDESNTRRGPAVRAARLPRVGRGRPVPPRSSGVRRLVHRRDTPAWPAVPAVLATCSGCVHRRPATAQPAVPTVRSATTERLQHRPFEGNVREAPAARPHRRPRRAACSRSAPAARTTKATPAAAARPPRRHRRRHRLRRRPR